MMNFDDLTPEQKEKARNCKTPEELHALAKEFGRELTDDELEAISGGTNDGWEKCDDKCGMHYDKIGCQVLDSCSDLSCDSFTCNFFDGKDQTFSCSPFVS